jgi:general secretion pathway protein G
MKKNLPKSSGFTLIELMVVITIIAVLSTIGLVSYGNFLKSSRDKQRQSDLKFIQSGLEDYYTDQLYYPSTVVTGNPMVLGSKTYLTKTPKDPIATPDYIYIASPAGCNNTSSLCTSYCLYAKLEAATSNSFEGTCGAYSTYNLAVTRP